MTMNEEYRDFKCFQLDDQSEAVELDVDLEKITELFNSEGVYLFVRYDLRRIFIWKGPRSPVRKRFISSRVASKIQERSSQVGMHLKIVSADAGDEPLEFLNAFNVYSYEVSEDEKPQDMYYLRNEQRRKMEEANLLKKRPSKSEKKEEYWSPIMDEQNRKEQMDQAKKKAVSTAQEIASSLAQPSHTPKKSYNQSPARKSSYTPFNKPGSRGGKGGFSEGEEKAVIDLILSQDVPKNMERLNIVTGTSLYGPKRVISSLFGKEVEEVEWSKVKTIPDGKIDIATSLLRVYAKDNEIEGIEILGYKDGGKEEPAAKKKAKPKMKEIPKGD